jgi:hypothetical protein
MSDVTRPGGVNEPVTEPGSEQEGLLDRRSEVAAAAAEELPTAAELDERTTAEAPDSFQPRDAQLLVDEETGAVNLVRAPDGRLP